MTRQRALLWALIALAAAAPFAGGRARSVGAGTSAQTWTVQAGGDVPAEGIQGHSFSPQFLTIHAGDTVRWSLASFMTVTFADQAFLSTILVPGPGAGEATVGPGLLAAGPTGPDAAYSGGVASSGLPFGPEASSYQLTFPTAGRYDYVDALHPGVHGAIVVLPAGTSLPETPVQAAARGGAERDCQWARLRAQVQSVAAGQGTVQSGGTTAHALAMGTGHPDGAGANAFLPREITVRRGDVLVWANSDPYAAHTVTFTSGAPVPGFAEPRPQASGAPLLVVPATVLGPTGGTVYRGAGYLNSGFVQPGGSFAVMMDAAPGTYAYACIVHFQSLDHAGTITVVE